MNGTHSFVTVSTSVYKSLAYQDKMSTAYLDLLIKDFMFWEYSSKAERYNLHLLKKIVKVRDCKVPLVLG